MNQCLSFHPQAPAAQQLLAACLVLREALRRHPRLDLSVPLSIHRQVSESVFGAVIYDTLAAEFPDLDNRLQIRVRAVDHFLISAPSQGEA